MLVRMLQYEQETTQKTCLIYLSVISSLNIKSYNHLLVIPLFSFNNVL